MSRIALIINNIINANSYSLLIKLLWNENSNANDDVLWRPRNHSLLRT